MIWQNDREQICTMDEAKKATKSGSKQFLRLNVKIWLWENPEASKMHYTYPLPGFKRQLADDVP